MSDYSIGSTQTGVLAAGTLEKVQIKPPSQTSDMNRLLSAVFNSSTPLQVVIGNSTDADQTNPRQISAVFYKVS